MMKIAIMTIMILILMTGCKHTRHIRYYNSCYNFDCNNVEVAVPDGYKINNENPYNKIETDKGVNIVFHLIKN